MKEPPAWNYLSYHAYNPLHLSFDEFSTDLLYKARLEHTMPVTKGVLLNTIHSKVRTSSKDLTQT